MAKIIHLDIKNYRGIKHLPLEFTVEQNLICLIGRGDSGKTTIVNAISSALSPSWNLNFYDTDFYNCDHSGNIEIIISLIDIPEKFLSDNKFGFYVRGLNTQNNSIIDDLTLEELNEDLIPVLTIKLTVDSSLEPQWVVTNTREQEDKPINGTDRAQLNCYMISDYIDRHFCWNKGNPLSALLKSTNSDETSDNDNIVIQYLREAKEEIDKNDFENYDKYTDFFGMMCNSGFVVNVNGDVKWCFMMDKPVLNIMNEIKKLDRWHICTSHTCRCDYEFEKYPLVVNQCEDAIKKYVDDPIQAKFELLKSYAIYQLKGKEAFKTELEYVTVNYPKTIEADHAQDVLDFLNGVKKPDKSKSNKDLIRSKKKLKGVDRSPKSRAPNNKTKQRNSQNKSKSRKNNPVNRPPKGGNNNSNGGSNNQNNNQNSDSQLGG